MSGIASYDPDLVIFQNAALTNKELSERNAQETKNKVADVAETAKTIITAKTYQQPLFGNNPAEQTETYLSKQFEKQFLISSKINNNDTSKHSNGASSGRGNNKQHLQRTKHVTADTDLIHGISPHQYVGITENSVTPLEDEDDGMFSVQITRSPKSSSMKLESDVVSSSLRHDFGNEAEGSVDHTAESNSDQHEVNTNDNDHQNQSHLEELEQQFEEFERKLETYIAATSASEDTKHPQYTNLDVLNSPDSDADNYNIGSTTLASEYHDTIFMPVIHASGSNNNNITKHSSARPRSAEDRSVVSVGADSNTSRELQKQYQSQDEQVQQLFSQLRTHTDVSPSTAFSVMHGRVRDYRRDYDALTSRQYVEPVTTKQIVASPPP